MTARVLGFDCSACLHRWAGRVVPPRCPSCGTPNPRPSSDASETREQRDFTISSSSPAVDDTDYDDAPHAVPIGKIEAVERKRIRTGLRAFDKALDSRARGGVLGWTYLLSGPPKVGKTTLAIQAMCSLLERRQCRGLYVVSLDEGSPEDVQLEAKRLGVFTKAVQRRMQVFGSRKLEDIVRVVVETDARFVVFDSAQTIKPERRTDRTVPLVVETVRTLRDTVAEMRAMALLVSHVSKAGDAIGPNTLQHDVSGLLELEHGLLASENRWTSIDHPTFGSAVRMRVQARGSPTAFAFWKMSGTGLVSAL